MVGARPNFIKMAPVYKELRKYSGIIEHYIVHTGQHYDNDMSSIFIEELGIPQPDFHLECGSGTHAVQTAKIMIRFEKVLNKIKPDLVLVYGDVNSTLAASLVCSKYLRNGSPVKVAHIESGLRSFDRTMPEEINRIVTDEIADYLFVTEASGIKNIGRRKDKKIYFVGNTMIDSLKEYITRIDLKKILEKYKLIPRKYLIITIHRPSNVDSINNLHKVIEIILSISDKFKFLKLVFPLHPRTKKKLKEIGLWKKVKTFKNILLLPPLGYKEFIALMNKSLLVLTDSGGIQEETTFLKVPCITLRSTTERPVTITNGTNTLCNLDKKKIVSTIDSVLNGNFKKGKIPPKWDGRASERIAKIIIEEMFKNES